MSELAPGAMMASGRRTRLAAELALLFVALPFLLYLVYRYVPVLPLVITAISIGCAVWLWRNPEYSFREDFRLAPLRAEIGRILFYSAGFLLLCMALVVALAPERLFILPRFRPQLWLMIMALYPVLSALGQEVIYRAFFFQRYKALFSGLWPLLIVNGVLFGYAHIIMENWVAVIVSAIGGVWFAWRYHKTKSLLVVVIEHGIYGNILFTTGLGMFFYNG